MRRTLIVAVLAGACGALIGLGVLPVVIWAQGGLFCWGSICQTSAGTVVLSQSVQPSQAIVLSTSPKMTSASPGDLVLDCQTGSATAPGPGVIAVRARGGRVFIVVGSSSQELLVPVVGGSGLLDTSRTGFGC